MRKKYHLTGLIVAMFLLQSWIMMHNFQRDKPNHIWTFTYLKAFENQKENLKAYVEKNWFAMDSIAVRQGLIGQYELFENKNSENNEWDFIVAVEYLTPQGYEAIEAAFEAIRSKHQVVKINGLSFKELGKVIKSENVERTRYAD